MVHRFEAVHRIMLPDEALAADAEFISSPIDRSAGFAIPHLCAPVVGFIFFDEVTGFFQRFVGLTGEAYDERAKGQDVALAQQLHTVGILFNSRRFGHELENMRRA